MSRRWSAVTARGPRSASRGFRLRGARDWLVAPRLPGPSRHAQATPWCSQPRGAKDLRGRDLRPSRQAAVCTDSRRPPDFQGSTASASSPHLAAYPPLGRSERRVGRCGSRPKSASTMAVVLVVAAPPEAGPLLVPAERRAIEPLVHAPQDVQPAPVRRVGVVDGLQGGSNKNLSTDSQRLIELGSAEFVV